MSAKATHSTRKEWPLPVAERMCLNKKGYTKREGKSVLNALKKNRGRHGRPESFRIYPCPICDQWHLTKGNRK